MNVWLLYGSLWEQNRTAHVGRKGVENRTDAMVWNGIEASSVQLQRAVCRQLQHWQVCSQLSPQLRPRPRGKQCHSHSQGEGQGSPGCTWSLPCYSAKTPERSVAGMALSTSIRCQLQSTETPGWIKTVQDSGFPLFVTPKIIDLVLSEKQDF